MKLPKIYIILICVALFALLIFALIPIFNNYYNKAEKNELINESREIVNEYKEYRIDFSNGFTRYNFYKYYENKTNSDTEFTLYTSKNDSKDNDNPKLYFLVFDKYFVTINDKYSSIDILDKDNSFEINDDWLQIVSLSFYSDTSFPLNNYFTLKNSHNTL